MGGKDNMNLANGIAGAKRIEKILNSVNVLQTRTIQSLIDNLNRRSVATATARSAALPTAAALNADGGGGGGGGGEAIYDTNRKMLRHYLLHPIWQPLCLRRQPRRQ